MRIGRLVGFRVVHRLDAGHLAGQKRLRPQTAGFRSAGRSPRAAARSVRGKRNWRICTRSKLPIGVAIRKVYGLGTIDLLTLRRLGNDRVTNSRAISYGHLRHFFVARFIQASFVSLAAIWTVTS